MNLLKTKNGKGVGKALTGVGALFIVANLINAFGYIYNLFNLDLANQVYAEREMGVVLTYPIVIYTIVMSVILIVAAFLILKGEKLGIFIYIGAQIVGTIYASISKTLQINSLYSIAGMILVLAWLVYRKKDIFFEKKIIV